MSHYSQKIGKWGEKEAEAYLSEKGYHILFKNWRAERGDIDIIALNNNCLVFVEVKGGSSAKYGPPELRLTNNKKRQMRKLATLFLAGTEALDIEYEFCRFDVVVIDGHQNKFEIRHYENAFLVS
ncbi:MAG: YraN family protein [bacterium]|nr:MAG: YraN family protein [bacterium]